MDRKMVNFIKEQYPPGTRIRLNSMEDPYAPILPGTEGEVDFVDDGGQIFMKWNNGRTLPLAPGKDSFTVLPPKLSTLKLYIKSILRNEKYCGDVLMQKTFQQDVINRRVIKNTGQLPMYLIENHHEGIVSREKYNAVQAEMARRKAAKSPSKRASTGLSAYTSRYALSDRLVCGECGTLYRRCTWTRPDGKRVVWRCVSRLDYGKKYCHSSPTLDEVPLQQAIIAALNTVLPDLDGRIRQITEALEAEVIPFPGSGMSLGDIDRRLTELEAQFQRLLEKAADDPIAYGDQFKEILDGQTALKELRATILAENKKHAEADRRIRDAAGMLENAVPHIAEWDESAIRQLVAQVKVLSKNEISVTLKSGIEIRQSISN